MFKPDKHAWYLCKGKAPTGICVLHKCDNRICVNPAHLFLGTKGDNNRDTVAKLRHRFGAKHWKAVLSDAAIKQIRLRYKRGETQKEIGKAFGVSQAHVSKIILKQTWKHLERHRG